MTVVVDPLGQDARLPAELVRLFRRGAPLEQRALVVGERLAGADAVAAQGMQHRDEGVVALALELAHAAVAGAPVEQERSHARPEKPRAEADRVVDLLDGRDAVVHEPERLAPQRLEQAVGDEAVDLLSHDEWVHADAR